MNVKLIFYTYLPIEDTTKYSNIHYSKTIFDYALSTVA